MKKILTILLTIPLIFCSCNKEDDITDSDSNNTSGSILGTWKLENYTYTLSQGYVDPVFGTDVVTNNSVMTGPTTDRDDYVTFRYDNTGTSYTYVHDSLFSAGEWNYTKNGNEIIIDSEEVLTINHLTSTYLSYNYFMSDTSTYNDTTFFTKYGGSGDMSKSNLPSITITPLSKKKPVGGYNSFLNRRENR